MASLQRDIITSRTKRVPEIKVSQMSKSVIAGED